MAKSIVYEKAKEYYPHLWPIERIDALLKAGKLTEAEYAEIVQKEGEP